MIPFFNHLDDCSVLMNAAVIHDDHRIGSRIWVHDTEESIYKLGKACSIEGPFNDVKTKDPIKRQRRQKGIAKNCLVTHTAGCNLGRHTVCPAHRNFCVMPVHLPLPIHNPCLLYGGHMMFHQQIQAVQVCMCLSSEESECVWFRCVQLQAVQPCRIP